MQRGARPTVGGGLRSVASDFEPRTARVLRSSFCVACGSFTFTRTGHFQNFHSKPKDNYELEEKRTDARVNDGRARLDPAPAQSISIYQKNRRTFHCINFQHADFFYIRFSDAPSADRMIASRSLCPLTDRSVDKTSNEYTLPSYCMLEFGEGHTFQRNVCAPRLANRNTATQSHRPGENPTRCRTQSAATPAPAPSRVAAPPADHPFAFHANFQAKRHTTPPAAAHRRRGRPSSMPDRGSSTGRGERRIPSVSTNANARMLQIFLCNI
ncbi:hypothetical protein EVAR_71395_1 [Eumeta japonica]|uniref:Uncharacterized protein n=1 Tax=Eumeta variegata TaxID=151549 RepID=A0A4C2A515_EUMVA|nr:hypothetical protein EVAR_71395_1 [Eumeta japonica]